VICPEYLADRLGINESWSYHKICDAKGIDIVRTLDVGDIVKCSSLKRINLFALTNLEEYQAHGIADAAQLIRENFLAIHRKTVVVK
jgi:hypothetical protein